MSERWYKEGVVYSVDVDCFQDSNGDGWGDLRGLTSRLDYLSGLGVTCLWLNPIHPSPNRDDGYDVSDYYGVDPRLGDLGDFAELAIETRERGIRLLLDLVVNHTSDQHAWFQSARRDRDSPFRDWYVWSDTEPSNRREGIVFPGEQTETWTYDRTAQAWYFHRFFDFQPDLNWANPQVRAEIKKVMAFWLQLGASGFRIDAAPFVLEQTVPGVNDPPKDFRILEDWREQVQWHRGDAILLCEANVAQQQLPAYCATVPGGPNDRAHMLFAFGLNAALWLALARRRSEPLVEALQGLPELAPMAQWATFLRNHDELDLSWLTEDQRDDVMRAFAPRSTMREFDRGIRRRLAPMLNGDRRHIELAYALQLSMPGTPVVRYGEEIGMGELLRLPGRDAIRTPMQWNAGRGAGFSTAARADFVRPVVSGGPYAPRHVNVRDQRRDPGSLWRWFSDLVRVVRECPEIGVGHLTVLELPGPPAVLVHRFDAPEGTILMVHNLEDVPARVDLSRVDLGPDPHEVLADADYPLPSARGPLTLNGWGYRWLRLRGG